MGGRCQLRKDASNFIGQDENENLDEIKPFLGNTFRKGKTKLLIQKGTGSGTVENNWGLQIHH